MKKLFCMTSAIICLFGTNMIAPVNAQDLNYTDITYDTTPLSGDVGRYSCEPWTLFPQDYCGFNLNGWINGGFVGNTSSPASKFNGPYNAVDRSNEGMLNQLYLVAEKGLPDCCSGWGARVDLLYGEDFYLAESIGLEKRPDGSSHWNNQYYGLALPQAYGTWGNNELSVQFGHFYSVVGYEGLMAPDNFFYTKSYSYQFAGPFTHWGGQINWNTNCGWAFQVGLHNGWDALDREEDSIGFVAKAKYDFDCGAWSSFAITTGDEASNPGGLDFNGSSTNRTRYSWLVSLPVTCRMEYVFHHWLGTQQAGTVSGEPAHWYGVDQYLYYTMNDCWKAGLRFEWFRDEDGTRVGLNRSSNPNTPSFEGNFYSISGGLNWTPTHNLIIRPEARVDWYNGDAGTLPFDDGSDDSQVLLSIDATLLF
ncbi:MAG: hypothetical protein COA78_05375 [Blastopirellula sp.]|nr:MAG: hypothetical protein COA78_05375 [Blastopirellula sp.]